MAVQLKLEMMKLSILMIKHIHIMWFVWNLSINILFRTGEQAEHRLEWEWESTLLYPTHPLRKVDLVCLAEFEGAGGRKVLAKDKYFIFILFCGDYL